MGGGGGRVDGPGRLGIEALPAQDRRRPYRLTAAGAGALGDYLRHARTVAAVGLRRLAASS